MRRDKRISVSVDKLTYDLICELSQNANMTMSTFIYTVVLLPFVAIVLDANNLGDDLEGVIDAIRHEHHELGRVIDELIAELENEKPPYSNTGVQNE